RDRACHPRRRGRGPAARSQGRAVLPRRRRSRAVTDYTIQQIINALARGSLYALMAVGLAMVFGILRLINFAHGDLMMIAAYIAVFSLGAGVSLAGPPALIVLCTVLSLTLCEGPAARRPPHPPERRLAADAPRRPAHPDRVPQPGRAERRRHRRLDHDPEGE